jgi:hypothetical protein
MIQQPLSDLCATLSIAAAASFGWASGKILSVMSLDKDDIMGPFGALALALLFGGGAIFWFVKRQNRYDRLEERREERREQMLVSYVTMAETSRTAIEEMRRTGDNIEKSMNEHTRAIEALTERIRHCSGNQEVEK